MLMFASRIDRNEPVEVRASGHRQSAQGGHRYIHCFALLATITLAIFTSGCGESPEADEEPPFKVGRLMTQPNDLGLLHRQVKPGHWSTGTLEVTSRDDVFRGELATRLDRARNWPYLLETRREARLPKGQARSLELLFYVPPGVDESSSSPLVCDLSPAGSRRAVLRDTNHLQQLIPAHQFYIVALASDPDRYRFLSTLEAVSNVPEGEEAFGDLKSPNYQLLLPKIDESVPLPGNPLAWTMVAYVLWDGFDPQRLSPLQQQAMLDWLHWGGQLLINGPGSTDVLRGSFLSSYLPATSEGPSELTPAEIVEFGQRFNPFVDRLNSDQAWTVESLAPAAGAEVTCRVGQHRLLVEWRVGRGRIVMSGFHIDQRELAAWEGANDFVDGWLFRRPEPRPVDAAAEPALEEDWLAADKIFAPWRNSRMRMLSRDASGERNFRWAWQGLDEETARQLGVRLGGDYRTWQNHSVVGPGVCGWNDRSRISSVASGWLRDAARIEVPDSGAVARWLLIYLVVLVPANWGLFRLFGRPELAWGAAPLIALLFMVLVVRWAQLDIGFARARTEANFVELHAGYSRAHVTRYTALYSSLSTTYQATFSEPSAVALPLMTRTRPMATESSSTFVLTRGETPQILRFEVSSNSASGLHSEYFTELEGPVELHADGKGGWRLVNRSGIALEDALLLAPHDWADVGQLASGDEVSLEMHPISPRGTKMGVSPAWSDELSAIYETVWPASTTRARRLLVVAAGVDREDAGSWRLIARTPVVPGEMRIEPVPLENQSSTVVVVHLKPAPLPAL